MVVDIADRAMRLSLDLAGLSHLGYEFAAVHQLTMARSRGAGGGKGGGKGGAPVAAAGAAAGTGAGAAAGGQGAGEHVVLSLLRQCGAEWRARRRNPLRRWLTWLVDPWADGAAR